MIVSIASGDSRSQFGERLTIREYVEHYPGESGIKGLESQERSYLGILFAINSMLLAEDSLVQRVTTNSTDTSTFTEAL